MRYKIWSRGSNKNGFYGFYSKNANKLFEGEKTSLSCDTGIKSILSKAIEMGGTTLRNFTYYNEVRKVGYFKQKLFVYGKPGENCKECGTEIKARVIGGRNSFFCPRCQT